MARPLKPASELDMLAVRHAQRKLREAIRLLRAAGCPRTLARTRLALSSAAGAVRHIERRHFSEEAGL